jgi:lactoylglutathione lyase
MWAQELALTFVSPSAPASALSAGPADYRFLRLEQLGIGLAAREAVARVHLRALSPCDSQFEVCLGCEDVDADADRLRVEGVDELGPPVNMPWDERVADFVDPDGNRIHLAGPASLPVTR